MIVYKYLSAERLDVLQNAMIRFTQLGDFNDLFEGKPPISGLTKENFVDEHLEANLPKLIQEQYDALPLTVKAKLSFGGFCELVKPALPGLNEKAHQYMSVVSPIMGNMIASGLRDKLDPLIGILSLSEVNDDPLMWATTPIATKVSR